ncbi:uncharacterized protein ARMOST_17747 [Armillaria ostoyae]|uniref:Uncharacterized protein n=1 Tax=Armillaria ostoyae TaxID=47428 RepID=A0A284RZV4_ARMOS|nr:uncharacterized protein ARMOST_17747 [Armillaria ostoyae]
MSQNSLGSMPTGKKATVATPGTNQESIRKKRKVAYQNSKKNKQVRRIGGSRALELRNPSAGGSNTTQSPPKVVKVNPMIALGVRAKHIKFDFKNYIDTDPVAYTRSLMRKYFSDHVHQGRMDVFTLPLDRLYEWHHSYEEVLAEVLQVEGCTPRRDSVQKAGQPLFDAIRYLEDIWCSVIEGPAALRTAYNKKLLAWQRATQ